MNAGEYDTDHERFPELPSPLPLITWDSGEPPPDPDQLLDLIRGLIHESRFHGPLTPGQYVRFIEYVELLDETLRCGFDLPEEWEDAGSITIAQAEPLRRVVDVTTGGFL